MQDNKNQDPKKKLDQIDKKIQNMVFTNKENATRLLNTIIKNLPLEYGQLINESFEYKRVPKEFLLSSMLFACSNAAGLAFHINCMNYVNFPNLYFAVVGSRGDTKSEAMRIATKPLKIFDDNEYDEYLKETLESQNNSESNKGHEQNDIVRKQLLLQNATIEATHYAHYENPYSIGLYTDELDALIEKMANKNSQDGNLWRIFFLQGYTNSEIDVRRKVSKSFRIKQSCPTLLGSIQHQFLPKLFANGNLESGFIDRLLFVNSLTRNTILTKNAVSENAISGYNYCLKNLLDYRYSIEDSDYTINSLKIDLNSDAEERIFQYSQSLLSMQIEVIDFSKEYISKMLISIHKLTLLVHLMMKSPNSEFQSNITLGTVELAILLNDFFFYNFKIIIDNQKEPFDKKAVVKSIITMAKSHGAKQSSVVDVTGLSKGDVSKRWNNKK